MIISCLLQIKLNIGFNVRPLHPAVIKGDLCSSSVMLSKLESISFFIIATTCKHAWEKVSAWEQQSRFITYVDSLLTELVLCIM